MGVQHDEDFNTFPPYREKRVRRDWLKLGMFYVVFYSVLIALFAICMWVFFQTLDPRIPRWRTDRSAIGDNPGLGFRPMPEDQESTLIWLQGGNITGNQKWIDRLNYFLEDYYTPGKTQRGTASVRPCNTYNPPTRGEVCTVDVTQWKECSKDNKYFFHKNVPCIFLKLNKIYGWAPQYITHRGEFPPDMPEQLKHHIESLTDQSLKQTVWISCEGETPTDVEYLGPVKYYPEIQGFPGYYYPYLNAEGYLSPLVAVHFTQPKAGIAINVECKAWAKNILHSRAEKMGSVHFELLID